MATNATHTMAFAALLNIATSRFRIRYHAEIPSMMKAAFAYAPITVCGNAKNTVGLVSSFQKLVISARPLTILYPTGCCIHEFAARMKYADRADPNAASQMVARCQPSEIRL